MKRIGNLIRKVLSQRISLKLMLFIEAVVICLIIVLSVYYAKQIKNGTAGPAPEPVYQTGTDSEITDETEL